MEDAEIIDLFERRDERAVSAVQTAYGAYCRAIAVNILKNAEEADACVNDVYLKAWNSIPPKKPPLLSSFLARLTKNHALNLLKQSLAEKRGSGAVSLVYEELEECVSDKTSIESEFERKELLNAINKFLGKTSESNRKIFVMRYWYCCEIRDIAAYFSVSENNVSVTLSRIRKKLKEHLKREGFNV